MQTYPISLLLTGGVIAPLAGRCTISPLRFVPVNVPALRLAWLWRVFPMVAFAPLPRSGICKVANLGIFTAALLNFAIVRDKTCSWSYSTGCLQDAASVNPPFCGVFALCPMWALGAFTNTPLLRVAMGTGLVPFTPPYSALFMAFWAGVFQETGQLFTERLQS